jgi:hypothetical protein
MGRATGQKAWKIFAKKDVFVLAIESTYYRMETL